MSFVDTPVYGSFRTNIDRANALIRIFERGRKVGRPRKEDTQLTRSSLVFSVGAIDAYLHDLVVTVVGAHVPQSEELDRVLREMDSHDLVQNMARAPSHSAAQARFRAKLDDYFDDKSFMGVPGLLRAMRLVGCPVTTDDLAREVDRPKFASEYGRYTDLRHRIIHRGENVKVTKHMARDCAELIWNLVGAVDDLVADEHYDTG